MTAKREYAPYFEKGYCLFKLMQYPLGIHYTSAARIDKIMDGGLYNPTGKTHFVTLFSNVDNSRLPHQKGKRYIQNRNIRYAMWLSHFSLEKVENDNSSPALLLVDLAHAAMQRSERPDEKYLSHAARVFVEERFSPANIFTHVSMEHSEYERLKERYGDSKATLDSFMAEKNLKVDLPTAVSAKLLRGLYRQFMYGEFTRNS